MNSEVWELIPNFPYYEASNFGRIRSITRKVYSKKHGVMPLV
jgi:hypothetical protein